MTGPRRPIGLATSIFRRSAATVSAAVMVGSISIPAASRKLVNLIGQGPRKGPRRDVAMATAFETMTCGRCGGTGHYSYCQRFGMVCFGCGGRKVVLTKRGAAAAAFYRASLPTVAIEDLKIGQQFRDGALTVGGDPYSTIYLVVEAPAPATSSAYSIKPD